MRGLRTWIGTVACYVAASPGELGHHLDLVALQYAAVVARVVQVDISRSGSNALDGGIRLSSSSDSGNVAMGRGSSEGGKSVSGATG